VDAVSLWERIVTNHKEERTDYYAVKYTAFGSEVATDLRCEVFGEDIGQQGWRTAAEQAEVAEFLELGKASHVLDVCCGSGGPSLALVQRTGCRLTGIDREEAGIAHARAQASTRGIADRSTFDLIDCSRPLPFADGSFDAVLCIDAISHLPNRAGTLRDWARLLRNKGRIAFTDVAVLTGEIGKDELDMRAASGSFLFVPPGLNEQAIKAAGFKLLRCEDRTAALAEIGARMCSARLRHASALQQEEGAEGFQKRQGLYAIATELAKSRRLSRFLYVAEKSSPP
jgi:SAM-dependent methyltransferase